VNLLKLTAWPASLGECDRIKEGDLRLLEFSYLWRASVMQRAATNANRLDGRSDAANNLPSTSRRQRKRRASKRRRAMLRQIDAD
jgi:hypothetical protein